MLRGFVGDVLGERRRIDDRQATAQFSGGVQYMLQAGRGDGHNRRVLSFAGVMPERGRRLRVEVENGGAPGIISAATARAVAMVVFPTPPFWLMIASVFMGTDFPGVAFLIVFMEPFTSNVCNSIRVYTLPRIGV